MNTLFSIDSTQKKATLHRIDSYLVHYESEPIFKIGIELGMQTCIYKPIGLY